MEFVPSCDKAPHLLDDGGGLTNEARACEGLGDGHARPQTSSPLCECEWRTLQHIRSGAFLRWWVGPVGECLLGQIVVSNMDWSFLSESGDKGRGRAAALGSHAAALITEQSELFVCSPLLLCCAFEGRFDCDPEVMANF